MILLLQLRAWTLFLILVAPAIVASIVSNPGQYSNWEIFANILAAVVYFSWLWTINYQVRRGKMTNGGDTLFYICLGVCFICFVSFNVYVLVMGVPSHGFPLVTNFVILFLTTYCIVSTSKAMRSFELDRRASFNEYFVDSILFIIFPIGLWFLQPRINKLRD